MSDGMTLVQHEDGTFGAYDDTYDIAIHCKSKEEQERAIKHLKSTCWIPVSDMPNGCGYPVLLTVENKIWTKRSLQGFHELYERGEAAVLHT